MRKLVLTNAWKESNFFGFRLFLGNTPLIVTSNEMLLFRKILPVHFLNKSELGREEEIMRDWLDVLVTESGLLVAQQTIERPPLMVAQMTEEWLNYYRKIAQSNTVPGTV